MLRPEIAWDFDKIYDLVALRIITDNVENCYRILGIIHSMYRPMPNYIRDYIAAPKPNGYRSIHTSVFGPDGKVVEIQIRTAEMHQEAEFGVASHLHYTEQKASGASDEKLSGGTFAKKHQTDFLKRIKEWQSSVKDGTDFIEGLKFEFLDDRIYVFSPKGDIYDLPFGATPVDFAYEVHSRIGDICRGAKVNGKIVPLDQRLSTRDVVEIITDKNGAPKRGWLDFVKTTKAKQHIRGYFRSFHFEKNKEEGEHIVRDELEVLGTSLDKIPATEIKTALSESSFKGLDDLYASVGAGVTTPRQAIKILLRRSFIGEPVKKAPKVTEKAHKPNLKGMRVQSAPCCNPTKDDKVVCYITRGRGLTAHKKGCKNLKSLEPERLIEYNPWAKDLVKVNLEIYGKNRVGLLRDIADVISTKNANIERIKNSHPKGETTRISLVLSLEDIAVCSDIIKRLASVKDIETVKRI
jgi:GTP pyrophosphokinase